jgi:hypothetical protein
MAKGQRISPLVVQEAFASGDDRFLDMLHQVRDGKAIIALIDRWQKDFRPWARELVLTYLEGPLNGADDRLILKRLFKHAEANRDDERMGAFMALFDRLARRRAHTRGRYDWQTRQSWTESRLRAQRTATQFSVHTVYYLQRRAWRHFRRMGFQRPAEYPAAVAKGLARYRDEDLPDGLAVLDSWGLVHACFGEGDAIAFNVAHANLTRPARLEEMVDPYFPELWKQPASANVLLDLLWSARSRIVRMWAARLLRRDHATSLTNVPIEKLFTLLEHDDPEMQQLGAELLENAAGLDTLDIATWLRLLKTRNINAVSAIADVMRKRVRPERVTLAQAVDIASASPVPVARLGLEFVRGRTIGSAGDRAELARLALAKCEGIGGELARFALSILGAAEHYDVDLVSRFFDSLRASIREGAWEWLIDETSAGWKDAALWSRLLETPYDDVRLRLVAQLQRRSKLPGVGMAGLAQLWAGVLLGIHRGGRAKLTALRQISDAVKADPQNAEALLPVLSVALRSVRPAEARAGLAAVVAAVNARPELEPLIRQALPELALEPEGAVSR